MEGQGQQLAQASSVDDDQLHSAEAAEPSGAEALQEAAAGTMAVAGAEQADPFGLESLIESPPASIPPAPREEQPSTPDPAAGEAAAAARDGVWVGQARLPTIGLTLHAALSSTVASKCACCDIADGYGL